MVQVTESGTTIVTGEHIRLYSLISLKQAIVLEGKGLKMSRGVSAMALASANTCPNSGEHGSATTQMSSPPSSSLSLSHLRPRRSGRSVSLDDFRSEPPAATALPPACAPLFSLAADGLRPTPDR
jgi:hypothetical protein